MQTLRSTLAIALVLGACGDDASTARDAGGGDAGAPPGDAGPTLATVDRTRDPACPAGVAWLVGVTGGVVDEAGAPVAGARPQLCIRIHMGPLLCLGPPTTNAAGEYEIIVPRDARCADRAVMRVRLPSTDTATTYCRVDVGSAVDAVVDVPSPYVIVATEPPSMLPPAGDPTMPRTVTFADGLEIDVVPDAFELGGTYDDLAARRVPEALLTSHCTFAEAPTGPALRAVWGVSREGGLAGDGFAIRIPNEAMLAAGTTVELWLVGGLDTVLADGTMVEEADWVQFGTGTVTADGELIASDAATPLPYLSWFGWR